MVLWHSELNCYLSLPVSHTGVLLHPDLTQASKDPNISAFCCLPPSPCQGSSRSWTGKRAIGLQISTPIPDVRAVSSNLSSWHHNVGLWVIFLIACFFSKEIVYLLVHSSNTPTVKARSGQARPGQSQWPRTSSVSHTGGRDPSTLCQQVCLPRMCMNLKKETEVAR